MIRFATRKRVVLFIRHAFFQRISQHTMVWLPHKPPLLWSKRPRGEQLHDAFVCQFHSLGQPDTSRILYGSVLLQHVQPLLPVQQVEQRLWESKHAVLDNVGLVHAWSEHHVGAHEAQQFDLLGHKDFSGAQMELPIRPGRLLELLLEQVVGEAIDDHAHACSKARHSLISRLVHSRVGVYNGVDASCHPSLHIVLYHMQKDKKRKVWRGRVLDIFSFCSSFSCFESSFFSIIKL